MESFDENQLEKVRVKFQNNWDVPDFRIDFLKEKSHKYCLIIPVINEGEKINLFVRRLNSLKISKFTDVIIVDGGSTDNSLNSKNLKILGIRGQLTKLGYGKLSAQLRIAYSFALVQGYEGIITIDGNNKDDPSSIFNFIDLLDNGYDFVQASRFIRGGNHKNTPIIRYLAIRLLHAPLLSIFSGFFWTDTTQGFRAYSRKCLLDKKLQPFRNIFSDYELLCYFNYRIPKIGLRCIEYPTKRDYPKGKIPTKIASLKGNFNLIKTLVLTCMGKFNP